MQDAQFSPTKCQIQLTKLLKRSPCLCTVAAVRGSNKPCNYDLRKKQVLTLHGWMDVKSSTKRFSLWKTVAEPAVVQMLSNGRCCHSNWLHFHDSLFVK